MIDYDDIITAQKFFQEYGIEGRDGDFCEIDGHKFKYLYGQWRQIKEEEDNE
jgi:hypothetical protein